MPRKHIDGLSRSDRATLSASVERTTKIEIQQFARRHNWKQNDVIEYLLLCALRGLRDGTIPPPRINEIYELHLGPNRTRA